MRTAKDIFDETMNKIKRLELFEIKREVETGWLPKGYVPFDLTCKNGIVIFKVYAEFLQDAEDQVTQYLERENDEQD
jgi:hypothetical protein